MDASAGLLQKAAKETKILQRAGLQKSLRYLRFLLFTLFLLAAFSRNIEPA
jgi:hypothetical protein